MSDLGQPLMIHKARRRERRFNLVLALVGLGAGGALLLTGLYRWGFALSNYGPAVVWRDSGGWLIVGSALFLIGLVGIAWVVRWNWLSVTTYDKGFILKRRGKVSEVAWSEVQAILVSGVRYRLIWGSRSSLRLELSGGSRLHFSGTLAGLAQLITTIKSHVYPGLLSEYSQHLLNGQPIPFGPLEVRPEGVSKGSRRLAWSELVSAELNDGKLVLATNQRGAPLRIGVSSVPNAEICLQLIEHYLKQASPSAAARLS